VEVERNVYAIALKNVQRKFKRNLLTRNQEENYKDPASFSPPPPPSRLPR